MKVAELEAGGYQETSVQGLIIFSMANHMKHSFKSFNLWNLRKVIRKSVWVIYLGRTMYMEDDGSWGAFISCQKVTVEEKNIGTVFSC